MNDTHVKTQQSSKTY